jgi:hypothetical protein
MLSSVTIFFPLKIHRFSKMEELLHYTNKCTLIFKSMKLPPILTIQNYFDQ